MEARLSFSQKAEVFSGQKAVLLRLNEPDALKDVIAVDSALPGGYYKRAWELVNATEKEYLRYVAELSK